MTALRVMPLLCLSLLLSNSVYAAFSWDSVSTVMEVLNSTSLQDINSSDSSAQGFSISAWAFPNGKGENNFGSILDKESTGAASNGTWYFQIDPNAVGCASCIGFAKVVTGTDLIRQSTTNMKLNAWNHVAMTWDGTATATGIRIYINGAEVAYGTTTNGGGNDSDRLEKIGLGNDDGTRNNTWNGRLSDIAIWSGVISPDEVVSLSAPVKGLPLTIRKKNLRGYWPLDDIPDRGTTVASNSVKDRSGNGNNATPIGTAVAYADDKVSHQ